MKKIWVLLAMFFVPGTLFLLGDVYEINDQQLHDLMNGEMYIAHAGGGYNGMSYTNSKEGVELALSKGVRLIELDVHIHGGELLFFHEYKDFLSNCGIVVESYDEVINAFNSCPFTHLSPKDIMDLTDRGAVIILDIKSGAWLDSYLKIHEILGSEKIVPQVYNYELVVKLSNMNIFDHLMYRNDDQKTSSHINYLNPNISMSIHKDNYIASVDYKNIKRKVFIFTLNKGECIPKGVGIYTDDYYY